MAEEQDKGGVPDALKDAIAENLRRYMRIEGYDPDEPLDRSKLAKAAGVSTKTVDRLLQRDTYPGNQPALKSLAGLARVLRVETHQIVYIPRVRGEYLGVSNQPVKQQDSAKRTKDKRR